MRHFRLTAEISNKPGARNTRNIKHNDIFWANYAYIFIIYENDERLNPVHLAIAKLAPILLQVLTELLADRPAELRGRAQ